MKNQSAFDKFLETLANALTDIREKVVEEPLVRSRRQ